jgi:N6-adenosine-specific RNA methylase IME4
MDSVQAVRQAPTTILAKFDAARRALAEAHSIDEVKDIHDKAEALRLYLKQAGESAEMQNHCAEIKLRAGRRAGEMLRVMNLNKGGGDRKSNHRLHGATGDSPTLSDMGLSRSQSSRWQSIADLPEDDFEQYISNTKEKNAELTTQGALRIAKEAKRKKKREQNRELVRATPPAIEMAQSGRRYQAIAIDPPWDWGDEGDVDQFGRAQPTYDTMSFEQVRELPVGELAADNAHIYLWITNRSLPKGFALLEKWGFRYVTCLTWCKPSIGMGNYFRGSTEQILFGVKGQLSLLRSDMGTWFSAPRRGRHSGKPEEFYKLVEECSPGPWLEMFARKERNGWARWGAEA